MMGTGHSDIIPWPPRSPDLTPTDLLFKGLVKEKLHTYIPPMPANPQELCANHVSFRCLPTDWTTRV
jgi:hypothetical protein